MKLLSPNEHMRITKSDYMRITEKGNFNIFAKKSSDFSSNMRSSNFGVD